MPDETTIDPAKASLLKALAEQRSADPLVGAKIAGKEILTRLLNGMKSERGVHVESLLTALGAIAGFACQMGVRAESETKGVAPPFTVVTTSDGRNLYYGDALNAPLAEGRYSIWSLCAGAAQHLGAQLPDVREIFQHATASAGTPAFGTPRFPGEGRAGDLPINYVRAIWPSVRTILAELCFGPSEWPIAAGLAAQEAILMAKATIDPGAAVKIVMESAIPMSKIDPREVGAAA